MDLLSDFGRMPRCDQATRIRELAVVGLAVAKSVAMAAHVPAPQSVGPVSGPVSPSVVNEDKDAVRRAKVAKFKGRLMGGVE